MDAYAVIETGGKQFRVKQDDTLYVERLQGEVGDKLELSSVLALSDGTALQIGAPGVEGAVVHSTILDHVKGPKVFNFKKKRRKGYHRKVGHRQQLTLIKIDSIA